MAMNKARRTANLNNILTYDTLGNSTLIANLTVEGLTGAGFVKADANGLLSVDTAAYTVVTGATNYLTKITAPNTLGQSLVYDNGTSVYVNSTTGVVGYNHSFTVVANAAGGMVVSTTNTASAIGIVNSASGNKTWDISPFNNTLVINESGIGTSMVFHPGGNITVGDITTTGHRFEVVGSFRTTGNNTLSQLSGVGTRMVVVDTNGLLSTQAIASGSVTGTGAAGQVAYWDGTSSQTGSNNLFWDAANSRLGIGTNTPAFDFDLVKTSATEVTARVRNLSSAGYSTVSIVNDLGQVANYTIFGSNYVTASLRNKAFLTSETTNGFGFSLYNNSSTANFSILTTTSLTERFRLFGNTGNVLIQNGGTFADTGERLQVTGNVLIKGSSGNVFFVKSSGNSNLFYIQDTGTIGFTAYTWVPESSTGTVLLDASLSRSWNVTGNKTNTSGVGSAFFVTSGFAPTSGTGVYNAQTINPTINQTGGANGITVGLYVNPTLTAAADWRSIQWSNNSGWGLYGAGTAANYLAGNLLLGSTTSVLGYKLEVTGSSFFSNYVQIGNGVNIPNGSNALRVVGYGSFNFDFNNSTGFTFPGVELLRSHLRLSVGAGTAYIGNNSFQGGSDLFIHAGWYSVLQAYGKVTIGTAFNSAASRAMAVFDMQTETVSLGNNTINANSKVTVAGSITAASAVARGGYFNNTLVAAANNDVLVALDVAPTFTNGAFTGVQNYAIRANGQISAGNAQATAGSVVLRTTYSSGNISNIGTNGSSGGVTISYGAYPASTSTADAFLSGIGFASFPRSAYAVESDHRWLSAASALVAEGSAVTLTEKMRLYNSGNLVIQNGGTYADTGDRLQVTGSARVAGGPVRVVAPTNTEDGSFLLDLVRPNGGKIVSIKDQALIEIGNNNFIHPSTGVDGAISRSVSGLFIGHKEATTPSNGIFHLNLGRPNNINNIVTATAEQGGLVQIIGQFNPNTAVSTPFTSLYSRPTINQTGGANGITRGIYVNPTLTAAADWRSIEWSNNSGYGLYGAGTAQNLLNGKLTVNHTVLSANFTNANTMGVFGQQLLNIPAGSQGTSGAVYAASSGFHYFRFNGNTTLVGDALWSASIAVSNIQFDTTGTVTMADGVGGGTRQRALSGMQIQMQTAGNNNGTVTKAAGLLIQGCYPSTGTGVTTFDQFAGIRINDLTEWGTARITMTDRWGIYQAGADDKNYFNGAVLIGTTTAGGSKLKVSGLPTSNAGLTAGDIWNDAGTLKIV